MIVFYNILQLLFLTVFFPFIIIFIVFTGRHDRISSRLGIGLTRKIPRDRRSTTIWLHALSVGEVNSAVPLVAGLHKAYPKARIIVSTATRTGKQIADKLFKDTANHVIAGPLDFLPIVHRLLNHIHPDLFILVETDFWPNILSLLKRKGVPTLLVNGRVSARSMIYYRRIRFIAKPMFASFTHICMQTESDKDAMVSLGIPIQKIHILGNLKFARATRATDHVLAQYKQLLPQGRLFLTCGSTHRGEERILIECYGEIRKKHPELFLIIAPRNPDRAVEIQALAKEYKLIAHLRSSDIPTTNADIFILDTTGELVDFYALSDIAFIGGSLVNEGGHNPIEPAAIGIPVLFGPNMQDFAEIAKTLVNKGGGTTITDLRKLIQTLGYLLDSPNLITQQGQAAKRCVQRHNGVIGKHLELINKLL